MACTMVRLSLIHILFRALNKGGVYNPEEVMFEYAEFGNTTNGRVAVSYTHLDVYKRQIEHDANYIIAIKENKKKIINRLNKSLTMIRIEMK